MLNYYYKNSLKFQAILNLSLQTCQFFCIQDSLEGGEDITTSAWLINKLLAVLKSLSHLLDEIRELSVPWLSKEMSSWQASSSSCLSILTVLWKFGPSGEKSIQLLGGSDPRQIFLSTVFRGQKMYPVQLAVSRKCS